MRAPGLRCASGSAQEDHCREGTLSTGAIASAHLPDTLAGPVTVWASTGGLRRIEFGPLPKDAHVDPPEAWPPLLRRVVRELREYFDRERRTFELPLDLDSATDFQREVYSRLVEVKYGRVTTYGELATAVGRPELARAVGQAVGANPVPIVVPCHRVIASEGRLGGFSGGLATKAALLRLEGVDVEGTDSNSHVHPEVIPLDL